MKSLNKILNILFLSIITASCKKEEIKRYPLTSLNVANFVSNGKQVKLGSIAATINNNSNLQMTLKAGENDLYLWPVGDSSKPYLVYPKFSSQENEIYSLFLHGDTLNPQGILIKENFPYHTDSTVGIRFINLSPNSSPLNITLSTSQAVNEAANLEYKQYTDFKTYAALYNSTYTFQVRDSKSIDPLPPLATFSLSAAQVPRFANITLVIRGMVGTTPALGVTRVNQER
jgi:hypothetical protein